MTDTQPTTWATQYPEAQRLLQQAADRLVEIWTAEAEASIDAIMAALEPDPKAATR